MRQLSLPIPNSPPLSVCAQTPGAPGIEGFTFCVVSLSGGKDSVACLLWALERWPRDRILAHHQVLPEDWPGRTVSYCVDLCRSLGVKLVCKQVVYRQVERPDGRMGLRRDRVVAVYSDTDVITAGDPGQVTGILEHAEYRGAPATARLRWCTSYHKRDLLNNFLVRNRSAMGRRPVVLLGMRRAESPRRSRLPAMRLRKSASTRSQEVWEMFPVLDWSRRDVFRYLRDHGVAPHPAYWLLGMSDHEMYDVDAEGGPRTSCVTCIFAHAEHLVAAARLPEHRHLFERVVAFEAATGLTWQQSQSVTETLWTAGLDY